MTAAIIPEWTDDALCAQIGGDIWFGEKTDNGGTGRQHTRQAIALCKSCPVISECLEWALATDERYGIWGGVTTMGRIRMRQKRETKRDASRCKNGHAWTPENTYQRPSGGRTCRACASAYMARYKRKARA